MRKTLVQTVARALVPTAALAIALGGLAACAHPSPPDAPYPTTAGPAPATSAAPTSGNSGTADQTAAVCADATSTSASAAATIRAKGATAQADLLAGNQADAIVAVTELKNAANDWANKLTQLAAKPVKPEVRSVLTDGATKITTLAQSTSVPADADSQLTDFTTRLAAACA
jgi:hypothetical protein